MDRCAFWSVIYIIILHVDIVDGFHTKLNSREQIAQTIATNILKLKTLNCRFSYRVYKTATFKFTYKHEQASWCYEEHWLFNLLKLLSHCRDVKRVAQLNLNTRAHIAGALETRLIIFVFRFSVAIISFVPSLIDSGRTAGATWGLVA